MSPEWRKALIFSLIFHLGFGLGIWALSRPVTPTPPKIVKISLRPSPSLEYEPVKKRPAPVSKVPKVSKPKPLKKKKSRKKTTNAPKRKRAKAIKRKALTSPKKVIAPSPKLSKKKSKSRAKTRSSLTPSVKEKELLARRIAELKAKAEERELEEKLAALKKKISEKASGISLSGQGVPQDILAQMAAHLKAFWEVPVILKDRLDLWAKVELKISPEGKILSWHFLRSSGDPLFDQAIESTLEKANPLPAPGKTLIIPAIFKIEEE